MAFPITVRNEQGVMQSD